MTLAITLVFLVVFYWAIPLVCTSHNNLIRLFLAGFVTAAVMNIITPYIECCGVLT